MTASPVSVLVVDDDIVIRRNLVAFLEDEGLDVVAANSGEEALATLGRRHTDVAVVDIRLPGMNGNEFILRAHDADPRIGYLIYTGSSDYRVTEALTELGIGPGDVFQKPVHDMGSLSAAVLRVAEEARRR